MLDKSAFSEAIDYVLQDEGRITAAVVPGLFQLRAGEQPLEARYRTRHRIEAVRRLWATADVHALALAAMLREDYDAARMWSDYLATEIKLDKLILQEAAQYDVDEARVRNTPPLRSTVSLVEALLRGVFAMGSMPSVAYAVMVEWHWLRASLLPAERAKDVVGQEFIRAIAAHPEFPAIKDHANLAFEVAHRQIMRRPDGLALFMNCLRTGSAFFRGYFAELYMFGGAEIPERQAQAPARAAKGA